MAVMVGGVEPPDPPVLPEPPELPPDPLDELPWLPTPPQLVNKRIKKVAKATAELRNNDIDLTRPLRIPRTWNAGALDGVAPEIS